MKRIAFGFAGLVLSAGLAQAAGPAQFYSVPPCRVLDTRPIGPLVDGITRSFQIAGLCGIPASAVAATLNVTATGPTSGGWVQLFPFGTNPPQTSTVNFTGADYATANGAVAELAQNQSFSISAYASVLGSGHVDLVLDVTGYFQ